MFKIEGRITDDPYVDASDIDVKVEDCDVVLTDDVSDRDQKRRAEDIVESISGVHNVENRIHVRQEHYTDESQRRGNYTGNTNNMGGIGDESGTTNEIIRNTGIVNTNDSKNLASIVFNYIQSFQQFSTGCFVFTAL